MKQTALITGGTGFLGMHLGRDLANDYNVILVGRNNKHNMDAQQLSDCLALPMDVTNIESVREVFSEVKPDIIIHAASSKSVDRAETQPLECVDVNVQGSQNVARAALERATNVVVGVSSTRAAPPVEGTYGLTKAIMERMFCSLSGKTDTRFLSVRLGNIAWSTGSVLPTWQRMIEQTGVINTTGPDNRRFFITAAEAVATVRTAIDHAGKLAGTVLAPKMKRAQMKDLLEKFVELRGGRWKRVDQRAGDKPDEILLGELELPYAREMKLGGCPHYVLSFNQKAENPVAEPLSTVNAEPLSGAEIAAILNNRSPAED